MTAAGAGAEGGEPRLAAPGAAPDPDTRFPAGGRRGASPRILAAMRASLALPASDVSGPFVSSASASGASRAASPLEPEPEPREDSVPEPPRMMNSLQREAAERKAAKDLALAAGRGGLAQEAFAQAGNATDPFIAHQLAKLGVNEEKYKEAMDAAAAERAERRAKAEARQAEERDVAGASDERSNSGEAADSHVEEVSAPRASELTEKTRDPIAAAAAAAAAAVAEGDRRLAEEAKTRRRAFALAAARGEEVTFAPSPVEMSAEATQQTLRVELSKLGLVSGDETEESPDLPSEAATRAAALFREMVETRRAQRA